MTIGAHADVEDFTLLDTGDGFASLAPKKVLDGLGILKGQMAQRRVGKKEGSNRYRSVEVLGEG